jgi:hypothetical protein
MAVAVEEAGAGRLSDHSREAASATAFELVGTYFADAPTWELEQRHQVGSGDPDLEGLAEAIRIRVALAAARRLEDLLRRIADRLSFRYGREIEEVTGAVRGRLDVPSYLRTRGRGEVPRRYPVRVLRRHHLTPENVLAMYAAGWVAREIANLRIDLLPEMSPERREAVERRASLLRTLKHPVLAPAAAEAEGIWRRGALPALLDGTLARLDGGHVAGPEPYRELVAWIKGFDSDTASAGQSVEWAIYDHRFDPTLFEIWMLHQIAAAVERVLGPPAERRPLWERGELPTYTWKLGGSSLALHFRMSLSGLSVPRWRWADSGDDLKGIPDVTALISPPVSPPRAALVDAKLRQREKDPVEEIYKLLGYFHNQGGDAPSSGAIVAYSPQGMRNRELLDDDDGRVLSLGVDPARGDGDADAFDAIAKLLVDLFDKADPGARAFAAEGAEGEEAVAGIQERVVAALLDKARALPPDSLDPFRRLLEGQLPSIWEELDPELRTMLVSAEYFGATAPDGADHSGAVLGLSAACERLLCGEGGLLKRMKEALPAHVRSRITLGSASLVNKARRPQGAAGRAIRRFLETEVDADLADLLTLSSDLQHLNGHRTAAAHTAVVDRERWQTCQGLVLGRGDKEGAGLLARVLAVRAPAGT